jgi:outer membrane autotransporter protein
MRRVLGFLAVTVVLAWPGLVLGEEYAFGKDAASGEYGAPDASVGRYDGKTGFYVAPRFLDSLINTGDINGGGDRASKTRNTLGGAIAVGYYLNHLDSRIPLRAEIEYAFRSDADVSWGRSHSTGLRKFNALFNVQTLQANLYWDIDTGTAFTPFIGGGLGMSFIYADYKTEGMPSISEYTTGFAWNAGAGVAYNVNDTIAVDLAYRFAGFGHAEAHHSGGSIKNYMTANEFLLGMRLNF